jgi:5,6-dimethylbenzimidazole synthase
MALDSPPEFDEAFAERLDLLLRWRRDVRHFRTDALPEGALEALVARAALAPSVGNSQPWRFVRVAEPARRAAVKADFERCNAIALSGQDGERAKSYSALKLAGLDRAPEHLAVFCDDGTLSGHGLGRATMPETLRYSAVGAVSALWLAARARGIGIGWVSILEPANVAAILEVPPAWSLVAYLCVD